MNVNFEVLQSLMKERQKQDTKWGEQNHDNLRWLAILMEEIGEISEAILNDRIVDTEVIHSAAVCVAWLECIERRRNFHTCMIVEG